MNKSGAGVGEALAPIEGARMWGWEEYGVCAQGISCFPSSMNIFQYFNNWQGHTGVLGLYQHCMYLILFKGSTPE